MSTKPGATTLPRASKSSSPGAASRCSPISATIPSRTRRSRSESREVAGSTIRPPLISRGDDTTLRLPYVDEKIENRHPHRDAVHYLTRISPPRELEYGIVELDAAVVRTRMHNDRVFAQQSEPPAVEPEAVDVLA